MDPIFKILTAGTRFVAKPKPVQRSVQKKEKIKIKGARSPLNPIKSFKKVRKINKLLYKNIPFKKPTTIQSQSFAAMISGRDIIAIAPTGSGKTLAYLLGSICNNNRNGRILCLVPTKELARQIFRTASLLTENISPTFTVSMTKISKASLIITTPDNLLLKGQFDDNDNDDGSNGNSNNNVLSDISVVIMDEADKLLTTSYLDKLDRILTLVNPKAQKALFSATIPSEIETIANTFLLDPIRIAIGMPMSAASKIEQRLVYVKDERAKSLALKQMMTLGEIKLPALVFCENKEASQKLFKELSDLVDKMMIGMYDGKGSNNNNDDDNDNALDKLCNNRLWYLIVSDDQITRGIDIPSLRSVINYAFPRNTTSYIHRIGRTGRMNSVEEAGLSITFFTDTDDVRMIANVIKQSGGNVPEWMLLKDRKRKEQMRNRIKNSQKKERMLDKQRSCKE